MRYSRQRQVILNIIRRSDQHPDADFIYKEAKKTISNISLGTIYRNLKLLTELGEIAPIEPDNSVIRYDGIPTQHAHFLCNKCKKMHNISLEEANLKHLDEEGYSVEKMTTVVYGYCPNCCGKE